MVFPFIAALSFVLCGLPPLLISIPLTVVLMLFLGFGNGVVFQVVSLRFQGMMGTASGFIGAAGGIGGFFLPSWFGLLKDFTGSFAGGFLIFGLLSSVAVASVLLMQRYWRVLVETSSGPK